MFQFVLSIAEQKQLIHGKTVGVDSTTLEANAAMKSIVRRDTGEDWQEYVTRLMQEEGVIENSHAPTDEELRRYDKERKDKKVSNEDWVSSTDPESRITQMKDGRTHLAYKAEHVVDLKSDLVLAAEIRPATDADTQTLVDSVMQARVNLEAAGSESQIEEAVADKGYHAADTLELCEYVGLRTYIPEPQRKHERAGPTSRRSFNGRYTTIADGSGAAKANNSSAVAANCANGALPISATPAADAEPGCEVC